MLITDIIEACGFEQTGHCSTEEVEANTLVRDMCASGKCQMYDHNWACPPACGDIDHFQNEISSRETCYLVQTVGQLEDSFDIEAMEETEHTHKERVLKMNDLVKEHFPEALVLSAGACTVCPTCSYPDEPCRFPGKRMTSMEAAGIWVSDLCTRAGIPYNHGPNTMAYTSCVLI